MTRIEHCGSENSHISWQWNVAEGKKKNKPHNNKKQKMKQNGIKNGKQKEVKMKCCVLRMAEVCAVLSQFKFLYSLNISCTKSFPFRNYAFRNTTVTLHVCPRSNFTFKIQDTECRHLCHLLWCMAELSSSRGHGEFHTQCHRMWSSKEIKFKHLLSRITFKREAP